MIAHQLADQVLCISISSGCLCVLLIFACDAG
jgi:hypothetical protein